MLSAAEIREAFVTTAGFRIPGPNYLVVGVPGLISKHSVLGGVMYTHVRLRQLTNTPFCFLPVGRPLPLPVFASWKTKGIAKHCWTAPSSR